MKIIWLMPYFGEDAIGGAEISNLNYIFNLDQHKHIVISNHFAGQPRLSVFKGVEHIRSLDTDIIKHIEKLSPDLIIATHELILYPPLTDFPYIIYIHDSRASCFNLLTEFCALDCTKCNNFHTGDNFINAFNNAKSVICSSLFLIRITNIQLNINPNPIPIYPFITLSDNFNYHFNNTIGITSVAKHKGKELITKVVTKFKNYNFLIAGSERLEKEYSNVHYTGYLSSDNMYKDFYHKIGLFVNFTIHGEAFGMSIIEAISCNIPVLFPEKDGLPESGGYSAKFIPHDLINEAETWFMYIQELMSSEDVRKNNINYSNSVLNNYLNLRKKSLFELENIIYNSL